MKSFKFDKFRAILAAEIANTVTESRRLRDEGTEKYPAPSRITVKDQAKMIRTLMVGGADEAMLTPHKVKGREIRQAERLENARARSANGKERSRLNVNRREQGAKARQFFWALGFAQQRTHAQVEVTPNESGTPTLASKAWEYLCWVLNVSPHGRFRLEYKWGSLVVDGFMFQQWARTTTVLPEAMREYQRKATQKMVAARAKAAQEKLAQTLNGSSRGTAKRNEPNTPATV